METNFSSSLLDKKARTAHIHAELIGPQRRFRIEHRRITLLASCPFPCGDKIRDAGLQVDPLLGKMARRYVLYPLQSSAATTLCSAGYSSLRLPWGGLTTDPVVLESEDDLPYEGGSPTGRHHRLTTRQVLPKASSEDDTMSSCICFPRTVPTLKTLRALLYRFRSIFTDTYPR